MKTPHEIVSETGCGAGFEPANNEFKQSLATFTQLVLDQECHAQTPMSDRALATVMALCALSSRSQSEIGMAVASQVNPGTLMRERVRILLGEKIPAQACFSANYGKADGPNIFQLWKNAGCPTGRDYGAWRSGQAMGGVSYTPPSASAYTPPGPSPYPGSSTIHAGGPIERGPVLKLTAAQEAIAKQMGRDPAEVAAWRAQNITGS